ncbi:hypothetical protein [Zhongshania sp.]|jgi:hypothetical protein|uniref:hypothetical protein n=1 Tax=Zhongshania sp. TaxID=1971902 RepID=UPI0039E5CC54
MDNFNRLTGLLFAKLFEEFPVPIRLTPDSFLEQLIKELDDEGEFNFPVYFSSTVKWLNTAGYIWIAEDLCTSSGPVFDLVLSEKGLATLRKIPESLEGSESIGERLVAFAKSKTSETVSTLISLAITNAVNSS